jgi:hypothetical protein
MNASSIALASLLAKYEPLGFWSAGELLLRPADALHLADELLALRVGVLGVDLWYRVEGGICEDPSCLDLSSMTTEDNPIEGSIREAKSFIAERLPPHVENVSFVLND